MLAVTVAVCASMREVTVIGNTGAVAVMSAVKSRLKMSFGPSGPFTLSVPDLVARFQLPV